MEKFKNNKIVIIIAVIITASIVIYGVSNMEQTSESNENTDSGDTSAKASESEGNGIESIVYEALGEKSNTGLDKLDDAYVDVDGGYIRINLNADENMSVNMTRKGIWKDTIDVLEKFKNISDLNNIDILWFLPLTDKYRNEENEKVMTMSFTRDTLGNIDFDNVNFNDIPEIADSYNQHPALDE